MSKKIKFNKEARLQVARQLQLSLPGLIEVLGQEEFDKRIKKVSKLLVDGIKAPEKRRKEKPVKITIKAA